MDQYERDDLRLKNIRTRVSGMYRHTPSCFLRQPDGDAAYQSQRIEDETVFLLRMMEREKRIVIDGIEQCRQDRDVLEAQVDAFRRACALVLMYQPTKEQRPALAQLRELMRATEPSLNGGYSEGEMK